MQAEEFLLNLNAFALEFFGLPRESLPPDGSLLAQALVAEALRLAMYSKTTESNTWPTAHVLALRNWVVRKLRTVLLKEGAKPKEYLDQVLHETVGPSLENLGDFIPLSNGYYTAAPTRVVQVDSEDWLLVSGRPTKDFLAAGLRLLIHGTARWIIECPRDRVDSLAIPVQDRESYVGRAWNTGEPARFLYDCVDSGTSRAWIPEAGSQAYLGPIKGRGGFQWGDAGVRAPTPRGTFSVWRSPREFERFDYFLKVDSGTFSRALLLPWPSAIRAMLALDGALNRPRQAQVQIGKAESILALDFHPPAPEMRWFHAMGGAFRGYAGRWFRWRFPPAATQQVASLLESMWLDVNRAELEDK